jgi:hypothetical protein
MRVFMVVVFVTVLVLAAWANNTSDAGQSGATSNPISLVTPTTLNGTRENPEF